MEIQFDLAKRDKTLHERGLDFARSDEVFSSIHLTMDDTRQDYGEQRLITVGMVDKRIVVLVWTQRGNARRIISMRYANGREVSKYFPEVG